MTKTKIAPKKKAVDTRLSYSSATLLKNCSMKYFYKKIAEVKPDSDAEENMVHFNIGKAFHWVLEENGHTENDLDKLLTQGCKAFDVDYFRPMIHAMLLRYLQVHQESLLTVVKCELEITNEIMIGFVDAIMMDQSKEWWIVDLKTAARMNELTFAKLKKDTQLNLYAYFANDIAEALDLDPRKFAGTRYRVTTKTKLKQGATEGYADFVKRNAAGIQSYDILIPKEDMCIEETYDAHEDLHMDSMMLRSETIKPTKNLTYCDSFFKPCPYWSRCHGDEFTECKEELNFFMSGSK